MNKIERIKELVEILAIAAEAYYVNDKPLMSDKQYDQLYDELELLEKKTGYILSTSVTQKVQGRVLDSFAKVTHSKPMLSAAKTKDIDEIKKFLSNNDFYCSYKLDGLTLVTIYENGELKQAITRGTGLIGEDVTEQAKMISNLPLKIPYTEYLELRGECVISWGNFNRINETLENKYSHPRNLAAGSLRNLDTNITKQRNLSYVVFECVSSVYNGYDYYDSKWDELNYLDYLGFTTVQCCRNPVDLCVDLMTPESYKYPVDGLIFEFDSKPYSQSLESTSHHEGCRMALKWADNTYETILRDVTWDVGRSGVISPVAVFDEVDLDGALTTKATLHNLSVIEELELGIGDIITVYRSNMVIPKVDENLTRSNTLVIPDVCPCCGQPTEVKHTDNSKFLMCTNPNCTAKKIAQFTHFVSRNCMNIDGLSEKILEKLISLGYISDFKSIYGLSVHQNELVLLDGFGEKSVKKLLSAVEKSRDVKLENFIAALGIPNIGLSAAKTISNYFEGDFERFINAYKDCFDWTLLDDFGDVMAANLELYLDEHINNITELANEMRFVLPKISNDNSLEGLKFCITGSFSQSRDELKKKLETKGAKFVSSISKNLDVLFCGDKAGSKLTKAQSLGVKIAYENELMKILGE